MERGRIFSPTDLPYECWVQVAHWLPFKERLSLALVCKYLFQAVRVHGSSLWSALPLTIQDANTLHSFSAWLRRCQCAPHMLMIQPMHAVFEEEVEVAEGLVNWWDMVTASQQVLPTLTHLMMRTWGDATTGDWIRNGTRLEDLGLYAYRQLTLTDALGSLTQLKDLSVESAEPLVLESATCLPPSLTKLFAVDSRMPEVPEAVTRLQALESAYLSRNPLTPDSLIRLAALPNLRLLSLIGCAFELPPHQLSALTALQALYLDYNHFGTATEAALQEAFRAALVPLTGLQALGLSHNELDSWPEAVEGLTQLKVLYLECNPYITHLPPSAARVLSRLRVLSCDASVLFLSATLLHQSAVKLEHLYVSGSGLGWAVQGQFASTEDDVLAALEAMTALKKVTFVVQTKDKEHPSVEVAALMLALPRRCPHLHIEALDSEQFFGVTLKELEGME